MDARFYNSEEIDAERLASDVVNVYMAQGYQTQQIGNKDQMLIQLKKGGDFEAIIGMQAAVSLTLQRTAGGLLAMIGQQRWIDKAAVGAVGIVAFPVLWPLALTAGAGAIRQASLGNQVLNVVDGLVRQQRPGIQAGPIPMNIVPQIQQQWGQPPASITPVYVPPAQIVGEQPPVQPMLAAPTYIPVEAPVQTSAPAPTQLSCPYCNTPYEPGDTFCTGCGRALSAPRQYCANCNSELKPGLSFCPKCGASTFNSGSQTAIPNPGPSPKPIYAPPAPQAPTYTPPAQPVYQPPVQPVSRPETPVYQPPVQPAYTPPPTQTPPVVPPTQVYYTPSSQQQTASPQQPTEPYYVPPVTQEPTVKPQPKVTFMPGTARQEPPPPQKPRPQKQYYIPSNQAQQDQLSSPEQPTISDAAMPTIIESTVQPAAQTATWGSLIFTDGSQSPLSGERAVIGRYDHDLGGERPQVDLSDKQGADTVSRIHAALEHIGSTYTLTDLNSTNATRVNNKRLDPDKPTPINDGDALQFGKVQVTFKAY